ncbi:MAG: hypothetical protein U0787_22395 [Polyangia bacterium]
MMSAWRNFLFALAMLCGLGLSPSHAQESGRALVRSVPLPPGSSAPPLLPDEYSRLGSGRLSMAARTQLFRFLSVLPGSASQDGAGRLRLLVQTTDGGKSLRAAGLNVTPLSQTIAQVSVDKSERCARC